MEQNGKITITIEHTDKDGWRVSDGEKFADKLGWDEMLALIASLTLPAQKPCLHWMKTQEQHDEEKKYLNQHK